MAAKKKTPSKTTHKRTPRQLQRDDSAASGLSRADDKKLLRELAGEDELRKVMDVSGFVPTTPDAYRIVHFNINGKPKKHTRYRILSYHEGRNGKPQRYVQARGTGCCV